MSNDESNIAIFFIVLIALTVVMFGCTNRPSPDYKTLYEQCQQDKVKCNEQRVRCLNVLLDCQGELK